MPSLAQAEYAANVDPNDASRGGVYKQAEDIYGQGLDLLQKQQTELGNTGAAWDKLLGASKQQSDMDRQAIQRQGARSLYANRGSMGGGGGLAALQNADAQNAWNVMAFNTKNNMATAQLQQQAQAARSAALGEQAGVAGQRYKMMQEHTAGKQNRINQAMSHARQIVNEEGGYLYTTDKDRIRMAQRIHDEILASETDPDVIAQVNNYINHLSQSNSGSLSDRIKSLF